MEREDRANPEAIYEALPKEGKAADLIKKFKTITIIRPQMF
jgi:hypothetical protein